MPLVGCAVNGYSIGTFRMMTSIYLQLRGLFTIHAEHSIFVNVTQAAFRSAHSLQ